MSEIDQHLSEIMILSDSEESAGRASFDPRAVKKFLNDPLPVFTRGPSVRLMQIMNPQEITDLSIESYAAAIEVFEGDFVFVFNKRIH